MTILFATKINAYQQFSTQIHIFFILISTKQAKSAIMPPKYHSKRNFSYDNKKNDKRITITFLLLDEEMIGIQIPYNASSSDPRLKQICIQCQGKWERDKKAWVFPKRFYTQCFAKYSKYCTEKQYVCTKIPNFVFIAAEQMPLSLPINMSRVKPTPILNYNQAHDFLDPTTLPFYDKLYDFQKQSLSFGIRKRGRLLLADQMGVGKTIQSLAIAYMFKYQWPMVIICPSTLRYNWQNQVLNWYGEFIKKNQIQLYTKGGATLREGTKILIISFDLAWKFKQLWQDFDIAIVDEAHYLKNSGCKRTDILVPLLAKKKRVILLTGTPAFARPKQIFNMASIVRPDAFVNFTQFGNRYCDPQRNPYSGQIQYKGCKNSKQLYFLLKDRIMIRRLKSQVLTQLPQKQRQKVIVQTDKNIVKQINQLLSNSSHGNNKMDQSILQMFGYYGHNGQTQNDDNRKRESLMQAYKLTGMAKINATVEYICSLLENDVKLLIFAHHLLVLDRIQENLLKKKVKFIRIDGNVPMSERQTRVDLFQSKGDIMAALLGISAAGVGLTLTASSTVVFAQMHWTPALMLQAEDRAHRIGQQSSVNCHYLVGEGTLDSLLYNFFLKKSHNVSSFVDGRDKNFQMQEVSKGQMGKISKKQKRQKPQQHRLSNQKHLKPIYKQINIQINQNTSNTDISSQNSHPYSTDQLRFHTPGETAKSRKKPPTYTQIQIPQQSNTNKGRQSFLQKLISRNKKQLVQQHKNDSINKKQQIQLRQSLNMNNSSVQSSDIFQFLQQLQKQKGITQDSYLQKYNTQYQKRSYEEQTEQHIRQTEQNIRQTEQNIRQTEQHIKQNLHKQQQKYNKPIYEQVDDKIANIANQQNTDSNEEGHTDIQYSPTQ